MRFRGRVQPGEQVREPQDAEGADRRERGARGKQDGGEDVAALTRSSRCAASRAAVTEPTKPSSAITTRIVPCAGSPQTAACTATPLTSSTDSTSTAMIRSKTVGPRTSRAVVMRAAAPSRARVTV